MGALWPHNCLTMSAGPRKFRPLVPRVPSAAIPAEGLLSTTDLLGSARLGIKPIFAVNRKQLYDEINRGTFTPPAKITESGLFFEAARIKALVEMLEASAPEPEPVLPSDYIRF